MRRRDPSAADAIADETLRAPGRYFHNRGARQQEQSALLRQLWENDVVDFSGRWHRVDRAGLNPRPSRWIPIWFGGGAPAALERAGRLGDGGSAMHAIPPFGGSNTT
jgi:alkanesulfonate monooxygenase SsuD/methylene tetrahydromethanopterin reductase-like flavin-dependent oxidoreductase (luciferase family)